MDKDEKRHKILEDVAEIGNSLVSNTSSRKGFTKKLGICAFCKHLIYYKTRLQDEAFWCNKFDNLRLRTSDPIETCTRYWHVSWSDIWDLKELATLIDPPKRKVGFGKED